MNNKLLSAVLVVGIATTGFAAMSSADDSSTGSMIKSKFERFDLTDEQKAEREAMKALREKVKDGTELTEAEQTQLDEFKANFSGKKGMKGERDGKKGGKRGGGKGMGNLTDEEKTALEAMTDDEKKAFFEAKKEERQAAKQAHKAVMDKIISGTTLTAEEKTTLEEMKAKHEERQTAKEAIEPILEKKKADEELSEDEEAQLEAFKSKYKGDKKGHGKRGGGKGGHRGMDR